MAKKVLLFPLNSPGHINSSLGIADRLKNDHGYETIFLVVGETMGNEIRDHGHELIMLEEAQVHEDYEVSDEDDTMKPLDEERKIQLGRKKKKFPGCSKWPQVVLRCQYLIRQPPLEAFIESLTKMEYVMTGELIANHDKIKRTLEEIDPDLIIVDAYYVPPCIVAWTKSPWVRLFSANPAPLYRGKLEGGVRPAPNCGYKLYSKADRLRLQAERPEEWEAMLAKWREADRKIKDALASNDSLYSRFLEAEGCAPLKKGKQAHDSPHINLYMFPKELDYQQDDDLFELEPRWLRCDSLMRRPKMDVAQNEKLQYWSNLFDKAMEGKQEAVYFSLGSLASGNYKLMRKYIDVFAKDSKRLYIVSKGVNGHRFELNESNMIGANFLPQTLLLQKANLAIIHGGNNSLTECMYFGKPMIILPCFADQLDNAQRVEDLSLGCQFDVDEVDETKLMSAINSILADKQLVEKCRKIGEGMRARDDAKKASLTMKKLLEDGTLDESFIEECSEKEADEINW